MASRLHLLLPLVSSIIYVVGAVYLKRATQAGAGMWRAAFVTNVLSALIFLPLLLLGGEVPGWGALWQPMAVGALLVVGQCASLWALSRGDVSVATPVMGAKVILVAMFTALVADVVVPFRLWVAAGVSTLAIGVLHWGSRGRHHDLGMTVLGSLVAAVAFALFDALVMFWSPVWGAGRLLPLSMGMGAVASVVFVPFFRGSLASVPRVAWGLVFVGGGCIGFQGLLLIGTLGWFGDATAVNIVYSTRGVWSVLMVWLVGRQLGAVEAERGRSVLRWRLAGAALMCGAVVSVFL